MGNLEIFQVSELFHDLVMSSIAEISYLRFKEEKNNAYLEEQSKTLSDYYYNVVPLEKQKELIPILTAFYKELNKNGKILLLPKK